MNQEIFQERLFEAMISGDRPSARAVVDDTMREGLRAEDRVTQLFWPVYQQMEKFHRADQLTDIAHHMGTRLLRTLVDQACSGYQMHPDRGRTIFACCGPTDADELGAQITVDLLEADGYAISFAAGGIAVDEILNHVQQNKPDILLMFASSPSDLPSIRWLVDTIREIGACDGIQFVVGGGVFARADGLAEEIGADLWANDPLELIEALEQFPERRAPAEQRTVGRNKVQTNKKVA
ncbi:MAG: cobalamin B12-binding domain-containing protein [Planctomycetota bacterium]|jgi:methanogenic corrinoid protein MtbC1